MEEVGQIHFLPLVAAINQFTGTDMSRVKIFDPARCLGDLDDGCGGRVAKHAE